MSIKDASIPRCGGYMPKVGGLVIPVYPLPGGGYEGITRKLDRAVCRTAKWMGAHLGLPVIIRFNSDRHSGGAWLADRAHDDVSVKIGAHLIMPSGLRRQWEEQAGSYRRLREFWQPSEADAIGYSVYIHVNFLLDRNDRGNSTANHYGHWNLQSARQARRLLLKHLDVTKVQRLLRSE